MQNILRNTAQHKLSPWLLLLTIGGYVLAALIGFQFVAPLFTLPFFDFDLMTAFQALADPAGNPDTRIPLLLVQGIVSAGTFVMVPWLITRKHLKIDFSELFTIEKNATQPLALVTLLVFTFMGVNSFFIEWNMNMELPSSLSGIEGWMKDMELQLKELTEHLIEFSSFGHFLFGLLVIAVLPGIGEELLFRGLIQNTFNKAFKNPHIAIWLAAILFGVFHLQFYGVIPRILLGALFGYIYFYSGHLGYAMIAHFVNNGFMIAMVYFNQIGCISYDIETMDQSPQWWAVLIFAFLTAALLALFIKYFSKKKDELAKGI